MPWTYAHYNGANIGICVGLTVASFLLMSFLLFTRSDTFYIFIELMFNFKNKTKEEIEKQEPTKEEPKRQEDPKQKPTKQVVLYLYGKPEHSFIFDESNRCSCEPVECCKRECGCGCWSCNGCWIKTALLIMSTAVLAATFVVFVDGIVLIINDVDTNGKCPIDGEMDCYSLSANHTYFFCNSSDTRIDSSLGQTVCYRWWPQDLETTDVLNQIGLCGGLIVASGLFVMIFMRVNFYIFKRNKISGGKSNDISDDCCCCGLDQVVRRRLKNAPILHVFKRPELVLVWSIILFLGAFCGTILGITLISVMNITVNGITYAILVASLVISMFAIPIFIYESNKKPSNVLQHILMKKTLGTQQQHTTVVADCDTDQKPSRNTSSNRSSVAPMKNS